MVHYLQCAGHSSDYKTFVKLFNQQALNAEDKAIMQTFADYLRQEGMQAGIYQERLENAKKMLQQGANYAFIEAVTGLSKQEIDELKK